MKSETKTTGRRVEGLADGKVTITGTAVYVTPDGWIGIKEDGEGVGRGPWEWPAEHVRYV
jgi:hypothetical protein